MGRLPGLGVAAAGAVHGGRHRRVEHEPTLTRIQRVVLGRPGLPRPPALEGKPGAVARVTGDERAMAGDRLAVVRHGGDATALPAA